MTKYLKFSHDYSKLRDRVFTTIRNGPAKFEDGETAICRTPSGTFTAVILYTMETDMDQLPDALLCYDTDKPTRSDAIDFIWSLYRKPPSSTIWTLYLLEKVLARVTVNVVGKAGKPLAGAKVKVKRLG